MKHITILILTSLILSFASIDADASSRLQFNNKGKIIKPDFNHIRLGLKRIEEGNNKAALNHFLQAAKYGNYYAYNLISTHHLNTADYSKALA